MDVDRAGLDGSSGKWMDGLVEPLVSVLLLALLTNACRCDFQLSTSMPGSKNPVGPFRGASVWLHSVCAC